MIIAWNSTKTSCHIYSLLDKNGLLGDNQYGFRQSRSKIATLVDITEIFSSSLDKELSTLAVFIDLKNAFDSINHSILLKKGQNMAVRRIVLEFLQIYLDNRQRYVEFNNKKSVHLKIKCGISN